MFAGRRAGIPREILPLPSGPDRAISAAMSERVVVLHTDLPNRYLYFYIVVFVLVFVSTKNPAKFTSTCCCFSFRSIEM